MNRTGKRRLLKLADMLEADAKNKKGIKFDLDIVVGATNSEQWCGYDRYVSPTFKPEVSCGTTACAMGLAAVSGQFKRAGLSFKLEDGGIIMTTWKGRSKHYEIAAVRLFNITPEQASYLFDPDFYKDKPVDGDDFMPFSKVKGAKGERRVARRIRKLVAGKLDIADLTV